MKQIEAVRTVAHALGDLNKKSVFVGGATVPFYLPETLKGRSRATEDVDVVIEVMQSTSREEVESSLRKKGFKNDMSEHAPLCRWLFGSLTVDIMSTDEKVLGFTNKWYKAGIKFPLEYKIKGTEIRILKVPYFLATKFEAFKGRGKRDYMASHDMEDIITIFDASSKELLEGELPNIETDLAKYLKNEFSTLLRDQNFREALPGAVFDRFNAETQTIIILDRIKRSVEML